METLARSGAFACSMRRFVRLIDPGANWQCRVGNAQELGCKMGEPVQSTRRLAPLGMPLSRPQFVNEALQIQADSDKGLLVPRETRVSARAVIARAVTHHQIRKAQWPRQLLDEGQ